MPRKLLALAAILAMLATTFEAGAVGACTAANPNANVIESTPTSAFTDHGNGTVTHSLTGLMWKQCAQGQSGAGCATGAATTLTWSAALAAAAADTTAGHSDWRLPNKKELESIVENCGYNPSINQAVFPATPAAMYFWSGSSYAPDPTLAWDVDFNSGLTSITNDKTANDYVRLVRGGQSFDSFDAQGDFTPIAFSFTAQTGAALSSVATSNAITVAGIDTVSPISIVGGTYSINGGAYTAVAGTVNNGDTVTVQQTASASYSTLTTATLTIGGVAGAFNVTTQASYTDNGNGTLTDNVSNLVWDKCDLGQTGATCTGSAGTYSWAGAQTAANNQNTANYHGFNDWCVPVYSTLGGLWSNQGTSLPNNIQDWYWSSGIIGGATWMVSFQNGAGPSDNPGNAHYVRLVRSQGNFFGGSSPCSSQLSGAMSGITLTSATLTATATNGASGTWYWIAVASGGAAPTAAQVKAGVNYGAVTFAASGNGAMSAATSQNLSITGLTAATAYDLYLVAEDGATNLSAMSMAQFTTLATDTAPDAFTFTAQTGAALSSVATSNAITVAGINSAANISIMGGTYSINGGAYVSAPGTVNNGQTVTVRQTASASYSTLTTTTLTIGGGAGAFNVTTQAAPAGTISYTAASATATGNITASFTGGGPGCSYTVSQYIPLTGHAASPPAGSAPAGVSFPHGLFDFITGGCTAGSTITMVITYPQPLPAGTVYWKYGPTPTDGSYHWYQLPAVIAGNTATFSITDGGLGDDDLTANGTIVDQGGPGGGGGGGAASIPTLSEWALLMLAGLMGLFGMGAMRRRKVPGL